MPQRIIHIHLLKRAVVLTGDLLLSLAATFSAYLFVFSLFHRPGNEAFLLSVTLTSLLSSLLLFLVSRIYRESIRYFSFSKIVKVLFVSFVKAMIVMAMARILMEGSTRIPLYAGVVDFLLTCFLLIGTRSAMVAFYRYIVDRARQNVIHCMIYSSQGYGHTLIELLNSNTASNYRIDGVLTTDKHEAQTRIYGVRAFEIAAVNLSKLFKKYHIEAVIFASHEELNGERSRVVEFCIRNRIKVLIARDFDQLDANGKLPDRALKPIQIEDLLGRQEIDVDIERVSSQLQDKVVMVTGAAGSIGREIARQVAAFGARQVVLVDVAETPMHDVQLEFTKLYPSNDFHYVLADVRSKRRMQKIFSRYNPQIIFHAAAYKHVPMIEANPCEGVITNVWGTSCVGQLALENGAERFVLVSTDKAVNPTNVMGASKRIAEMCVQHLQQSTTQTEFIITRFGNVLDSNGSVIPLFKSQIAAGGPVTVTHPDIIRYFMTIPEACRLVMQAATMGHRGEILVFDMGEQIRIADLAKKMIRLSGFEPGEDMQIEYTGLRPGEKLYEELLSSAESSDATQHQKIRVAHCEYPSTQSFYPHIKELITTALRGDREGTVRLMKRVAPEFKSRNSEYERFDA